MPMPAQKSWNNCSGTQSLSTDMPRLVAKSGEDLLEAVKAGREDKVRALLASGSKVGTADQDGKTALHWACQYGHFAILCVLLAHLPAPQHDVDSCTGRCKDATSRHTCTGCCHICGIADSNRRIDAQQSECSTPSLTRQCVSEPEHCHAAKVDCYSSLCKLERRYHVQCCVDTQIPQHRGQERSQAKDEVLQTQSTVDSIDSSQRCLHHQVLNARDTRGQTPLMVACQYSRADLASLLLTFACCEVSCQDNAGNTPLHRAIRNSQDTLACLLCGAGADVHATGRHRLTPLHEAVRAGRHRVIHALVTHGCDVNARSISVAAPTPFLAAIFHFKTSQRSPEDRCSVDGTLALLINAGCRLSDGDGYWTPLTAAIDISSGRIASLLLFHGCRLYSRHGQHRGHGRSLMVEAFTRCNAAVVKLLMTCGYRVLHEEVDQCSRRIPAFSPVFYRISHSQRTVVRDKLQLLHWLRQQASNPPSLLELCRTRIRQTLNHAANDLSIIGLIPSLPLPQSVKDYISLTHLDFSTCPNTHAPADQ